MGEFGDYRERLAAGIAAGMTLEQLDEELIDGAPLDDDEKAALWLFGFALLDLRGDTSLLPSQA